MSCYNPTDFWKEPWNKVLLALTCSRYWKDQALLEQTIWKGFIENIIGETYIHQRIGRQLKYSLLVKTIQEEHEKVAVLAVLR